MYVEHTNSRKMAWIGYVDFDELRNQRDELVEINRDIANENIDGLINFLDVVIDSYLDVKSIL